MRQTAILLLIFIIAAIHIPYGHSQNIGNIEVLNINLSNSHPVVGEEITVWVNLSSTQAYYNVDIALYYDFSVLFVKKIPHIDGSGKIFFTVYLEEEGIHNITVVVDYLNNITEENEGDNSAYTQIYIEPRKKPDLYISDIQSSQQVILAGQKTTFYIYIEARNSSVYGVDVAVYIDDVVAEVKTVPYIAENSSYYIFFVRSFQEGEHRIEAVIDYPDQIDEENEENNYFGRNFTVYPSNFNCNIAVKGVYSDVSSAYYGETITMYTVIFNDSNYTLSHVTLAVLYDFQIVRIFELPPLISRQSLNVSFSVTCYTNLSGENHTIYVYADYNNIYNETNEDDNLAHLNIKVYTNSANIVLTPADIYLSSSHPVEGTFLTIYGRIWNVGDVETFVNASLKVDDEFIGNFSLSILPKSSKLINGVWLARRGWHNVSVLVGGQEVRKLIWVEPSIPVISFVNNSLEISQEKVYLNESVWIYVKLRNYGNSSCNDLGVVFTERRNDTLKIIGFLNMSIGARSYAYAKILWLPKTVGNVTITAEFVPQPYISFKNMNISRNVTVVEPLPDLVIVNYSISVKNYSAVLNITLENRGELAAQNFKIGVFVNGKLVNDTFVSILPSLSKRNISMNLSLVEGVNNIEIVADYENVLREHDETDNSIKFTVRTPYRGIPVVLILATILASVGIIMLLAFFSKRVRFILAAIFFSIYEIFAKIFSIIGRSSVAKGFREKYEEFRRR